MLQKKRSPMDRLMDDAPTNKESGTPLQRLEAQKPKARQAAKSGDFVLRTVPIRKTYLNALKYLVANTPQAKLETFIDEVLTEGFEKLKNKPAWQEAIKRGGWEGSLKRGRRVVLDD